MIAGRLGQTDGRKKKGEGVVIMNNRSRPSAGRQHRRKVRRKMGVGGGGEGEWRLRD